MTKIMHIDKKDRKIIYVDKNDTKLVYIKIRTNTFENRLYYVLHTH